MSRLLILLAVMCFSSVVYAADIRIEGAWSRATVPGQEIAMVDMSITSDKAAKLVGVSSPACGSAQLHSMSHENGMMKMREVTSISLAAGKTLHLDEAGYHLMLVGLKSELKAGDSVPLTLSIKEGSKLVKVEVQAQVRSLTDVTR